MMHSWNAGWRSKYTVVGYVDRTGAGQALCEQIKLRQVPSILYGNPLALSTYEHDISKEKMQLLELFLEDKIKPLCHPSQLQYCEGQEKQNYEELLALSDEEINERIASMKGAIGAEKMTLNDKKA